MKFLFEPFIYRSHLGAARSDLVGKAVQLLVDAYQSLNYPGAKLFAGDNLIVMDHAQSFFDNKPLLRSLLAFARHPAISDQVEEPQVLNRIWRHHIKTALARSSLRNPGALCEYGVYTGESAFIIRHYLHESFIGRTYWLYDIFDHEKMADKTQRGPAHTAALEGKVRALFSHWPDVEIVAGLIPGSLKMGPPEICFAHIDLNSADAEEAASRHTLDRMRPGGIILYDDYGWTGHEAQRERLDRLYRDLGTEVVELPTGQGLVVRP